MYMKTLRQRKMATIFKTINLNAFSWMKIVIFWWKFQWNLFPRVQLTIFQHYLNQRWLSLMACCLTAPNHYMNHCWLIINEILLWESESNFTGRAQEFNPWHELENYTFKIIAPNPRGQWVKTMMAPSTDTNRRIKCTPSAAAILTSSVTPGHQQLTNYLDFSCASSIWRVLRGGMNEQTSYYI